VGHLEAVRAGHALHAALAQKLMESEGAWALVAHPQLPVLERPQAVALAAEPGY
jgi:UDP-3-O-acyl-N-acetylglucosamine deacetylase